jgi:mono/diheme cytochrome c family protein
VVTSVAAAIVACAAAPNSGDVHATKALRGAVSANGRPIPGAVVTIQATGVTVQTDAAGMFEIAPDVVANLRDDAGCIALTAWANGFYINGPVTACTGDDPALLQLEAHPREDHAAYPWVQAAAKAGEKGHCQTCHSAPEVTDSLLPYDEWLRDAHSQSAVNPRFLTMYLGTDLDGRQGPPTRYVTHPDYGRVPLPPDAAAPYYGAGFKNDFPNAVGNCAQCHAPAAVTEPARSADPTLAVGAASEGVTCDLCHKIWDVRLDPASGLPLEDRPGVLSIVFRRPTPDRQLFFGPLADVAPGDDAYAPIYQESRFCAPCHSAKFWGVQIYNSYGEWLDSPYSDPQTGQTCQNCHMPRRGTCFATRPDKGGIERDPATIASHEMPGAADLDLLRSAADLDLYAERTESAVYVTTRVTNSRTGHHLPTDSPLRNMLLVIRAHDQDQHELALVKGPVLPLWADDLAGLPGRGYAKILEELWTEISPTAAYWNPVRVVEDTRLPALASDELTHRFESRRGEIVVSAQLIFRRALPKIAQQKGWPLEDVIMAERTITISDTQAATAYRP